MTETETPPPPPKRERMSKDEKRQVAAAALAQLGALVDMSPDTATIRRIAAEEIAKARPVRVEIHSPAGVRDMGERILHPLFNDVLRAVAANVAPMIFGAAGSGKTTLAAQIADALGLPFHFTGAVMKKHELLGYMDARGAIVRTAFRDAFERGGVFLFDEVDASSPQALLCINAALSNGWCDFPDGRLTAHKDFRFIASANTLGNGSTREYCGRNQLDGATLDRFAVFQCEYDPGMTARLVSTFDLDPEARAVADDFAKRVDEYRAEIAEQGLRVILSPRAALMGAKLAAQGFTAKQMTDCLILSKIGNADERERIQRGALKRVKERQEREQVERDAAAALVEKEKQEAIAAELRARAIYWSGGLTHAPTEEIAREIIEKIQDARNRAANNGGDEEIAERAVIDFYRNLNVLPR